MIFWKHLWKHLREHHSRFHYRRSLACWHLSEVFNGFSQNGVTQIVRINFFLFLCARLGLVMRFHFEEEKFLETGALRFCVHIFCILCAKYKRCLFLSNSLFYYLSIFKLAALLLRDRTVKVHHSSVLFACLFRVPFFSQVVYALGSPIILRASVESPIVKRYFHLFDHELEAIEETIHWRCCQAIDLWIIRYLSFFNDILQDV